MGFPGGSVVKNPPPNGGDAGSIPGSGRAPVEGNGNAFQYSCLGNLMGRGTWQAIVHGVSKELDTTWQLNHNIRPPTCSFNHEKTVLDLRISPALYI